MTDIEEVEGWEELREEIGQLEEMLIRHVKQFGLEPRDFKIKVTLEYLDQNRVDTLEVRDDDEPEGGWFSQ